MHKTPRPTRIWTPQEEAAFLAVAPARLRLAHLLMVETGQRLGDLLALPWDAYDGSHLRVRRRKDGHLIAVPVSAPLKAALDAAAETRQGATLLATPSGRPWTAARFADLWRRAVAKAGLSGLSVHDLRLTAPMRFAEAGRSLPEIAYLLGLDTRRVDEILADHAAIDGDARGESVSVRHEPAPEIPN